MTEPSDSGPIDSAISPGAEALHEVISAQPTITERQGFAQSGFLGLAVVALLVFLALLSLAAAITAETPALVVLAILFAAAAVVALAGFFLVQPNRAMVLILFGQYVGTIKGAGFYWTNPFTVFERRSISQRVVNFTTATSKINDAEGNPIEIAAVVVWRVTDTARAVFEVDDHEHFVHVQAETAIRHLGTKYPYEDFTGNRTSLRSDPDVVANTLHEELQLRLELAGVEVVEARLTHLAYATEIAEAMLRRQQAEAVVAARRTIVEGAVGMVEDALEMLSVRKIVELDDERRAQMVSNLLVVLTSEQQTTPIVNAGSMY